MAKLRDESAYALNLIHNGYARGDGFDKEKARVLCDKTNLLVKRVDDVIHLSLLIILACHINKAHLNDVIWLIWIIGSSIERVSFGCAR